MEEAADESETQRHTSSQIVRAIVKWVIAPTLCAQNQPVIE